MKKILIGIASTVIPMISVSADTHLSSSPRPGHDIHHSSTGQSSADVMNEKSRVVQGEHIKETILIKRVSAEESRLKGLHLAIGALSPSDREALIKMIHEYLLSKGIDPAKYADMRDEIQHAKKELREEIQEIKKENQEKIKNMRKMTKEEIEKKKKEMREAVEALKKKKEYTGHVTLMK